MKILHDAEKAMMSEDTGIAVLQWELEDDGFYRYQVEMPEPVVDQILAWRDQHNAKEEAMEINVGEQWYVQLAPKATLVEVTIEDVTEKTILIRETEMRSRSMRYVRGEIKFIERVKGGK